MFHKTIISIIMLYLISALLPAYAKHDGSEGHDQNAKPIVNKPVSAADVTVLPGEAGQG